MLAATLAVGVFAIITGAMAEDAIADAADGLFGGQTKAERLEIFKDSALGTYGVIALVLYIAARIFALGAIAALMTGTMTASRFIARCWFSNWPPQLMR